jgi:MFS family permease
MRALLANRSIRGFTVSTLVTTSGDGLYIAGSALFFTSALKLPVGEVGLGLTCAGVLGLSAGVPLGRVADHAGARDVLIAAELVQGAAIAAFVLVGRSFPAFVAVATVVIACMQGTDAAKGALIGKLAAEDPVRLRAFLHSVSNIGISVGTVLAGIAIAAGTPLAYRVLMLADAISFVGAAALLLALPRVREQQPVARVRRRWGALRDRFYVTLTLANCVMSVQYFVLAFAMPLWVIGHTSAPRWLVSPMLLINTTMIVLLQVRFARGTKTPRGGARSALRAGVALAAAMALYAAASGRGELAAAVLLLLAVLEHSIGELLQSAGSFGVSYGLAEQSALGEYLGVYGLGIGVCRAVAPGILAATCLSHGATGWAALAAAFLVAGAAAPPLVRRAEAAAESRATRYELAVADA